MRHLYILARQLFMTIGTILLIAGFAITLANALPYLFVAESYVSFFGDRDPQELRHIPALLHIAPAIVALMVGPFQFSVRSRKYVPQIHRVCGWIYITSVFTSASASLILVPYTFGGAVNGLGFGILAVLWLSATLIATIKAIQVDISQHQQWMMRSYVLTCAGVMFRLEMLVLQQFLSWSYYEAYSFSAWACWVPGTIALEIWLRVKRHRL